MSSRSLALAVPLSVVALGAMAAMRVVERPAADLRAAALAPSAPMRPPVRALAVGPAEPSVPTPAVSEPTVAAGPGVLGGGPTARVAASPASPATTLGTFVEAAEVSAPRTRFRLGESLPLLGGDATAWRLAPTADPPSGLTAVVRALAPGASVATDLEPVGLADGERFTTTAVSWEFVAPTLVRPLPDRCVGLDLDDPRTFPRCDAALAEAKVAWRGGAQAVARARALWERMGYDLTAFAVADAPDADGYVVAHLVLDGQPVAFGLRVRFQGDAVEQADGVLVVPHAVGDERTPTPVPLVELQTLGVAEVRLADGTILPRVPAGGDVTLVGVEPVLVPVAAPAGDPNLYVAPGYAFVGTDSRRYCRPAALMMPWLAAALGG